MKKYRMNEKHRKTETGCLSDRQTREEWGEGSTDGSFQRQAAEPHIRQYGNVSAGGMGGFMVSLLKWLFTGNLKRRQICR